MNKNEDSSSTIQKSLKKIWTSARQSINPLKSTGFESWFKRTDPGINLLANILSNLVMFQELRQGSWQQILRATQWNTAENLDKV